jgi:predicted ABC-type exoprotein transport system permease subunit
MTRTFLRNSALLALTLALGACEFIGGVFKAGFWAGFIIVLLAVALIAWFMQRHKS